MLVLHFTLDEEHPIEELFSVFSSFVARLEHVLSFLVLTIVLILLFLLPFFLLLLVSDILRLLLLFYHSACASVDQKLLTKNIYLSR